MPSSTRFRFSTRYQDDETGFIYYGYRYYSANSGRWLTRDPIEEQGGMNALAFLRNEPMTHVDKWGLLLVGDVVDFVRSLNDRLSQISCCCGPAPSTHFNLTGTSTDSTVTLTVHPHIEGDCPVKVLAYFWWNCFQAQHDFKDAGGSWLDIARGDLKWTEYGYYLGGATESATHDGYTGFGEKLADSGKWAWHVIPVFTYCLHGKMHAGFDHTPDFQFSWQDGTRRWGWLHFWGPLYWGPYTWKDPGFWMSE